MSPTHWVPWQKMMARQRPLALGLVIFCIIFGSGIFFTVHSPKIYESVATVLIEQTAPQVLAEVNDVYRLGTRGYWSQQEYYRTQYKIIQSRPVLEKTAIHLGLVPAALLAKFQNKTPIEPNLLHWLHLDDVAPDDQLVKELETVDAAQAIGQWLQIRPIRESRLVEITARDSHPELAMHLVNTVAKAYTEYNLEQKITITAAASNWLKQQLHELKKKLDQSEQNVHAFKKQNALLGISLTDHRSMLAQSLAALNQAWASEKTQSMYMHSQLQNLRASKTPAVLAQWTTDPVLQTLKNSYYAFKQKQLDLDLRYTRAHPKHIAITKNLAHIQQDIDREKSLIADSIRSSWHVSQTTQHALTQEIGALKERALELNRQEVTLNRLKRERDNNLALYNMVLKRQKETDLTHMLSSNNVRILEYATLPKDPIRPRVALNLALSCLCALCAACAVTWAAIHWNFSIISPEQIENDLHMTFLGMLPTIATAQHISTLEQTAERDRMVAIEPRSSIAECARTIRTNLQFTTPTQDTPCLLITSVRAQEGKTTVANNMAASLAQSGAKTLLVDADLRRPRLHRTYALNNHAGLSTLLVGQAPIDDAIQTSGQCNLSILPSGPLPPNPAELLQSPNFVALMQTLKQQFEHILIDSPPVGALADALSMAPRVDGVVLVVQANKTPLSGARQVQKQIHQLGGKIIGVVLNDIAPQTLPHYAYGYEYAKA